MTERPWHERTPHVVGASLAALAAIALLYFAGSWLVRHNNQPQTPPVPVIVDDSGHPSTTAVTTSTPTSTSYSSVTPSTTDIDVPPTTDTTTTSPTSTPSGDSTTTSRTPKTSTSITQSRRTHPPGPRPH